LVLFFAARSSLFACGKTPFHLQKGIFNHCHCIP
jgi:hypothetical protein